MNPTVQYMGQQVLIGVIVFVLGSVVLMWLQNRKIIAPPVAKNEDGILNSLGF